MLISKDKVIEEISQLWPKCYLVPSDQEVLCPSKEEFQKLFIKIKAQLIRLIGNNYIKRIFECEDSAKAFAGQCVIVRAMMAARKEIPPDKFYSWSVGICFGTKFNAWEGAHWQIIVRLKEGWYLYDPQTEGLWKASPVDDDVMFFLM